MLPPHEVYAPLPLEVFELARDLSDHEGCVVFPHRLGDYTNVTCMGYHCAFCGAGVSERGHQDAGECLRHYSTLVADYGEEGLT